MIVLSSSYIYSLSLFLPFFYFAVLLSIILYLLPVMEEYNSSSYTSASFTYVSGCSVGPTFFALLLLLLITVSGAQAAQFSLWMGHLVFSHATNKLFYLLALIYAVYILIFLTSTYFISSNSYDFLIANLNSMLWLYVLFLSNSLISTFFVVEVLSSILFLLLVTSSFSSSNFYVSLDISGNHFLQDSLPSAFLNSVILFFWVSLLSSLNLFVFTLVIYLNMFSFDWYIIEHVFTYLSTTSSFEQLFSVGVIWYIIVFSIFTNCGLAPFFFWNPTFFNGLTFSAIFFYICIFYFSIFIFLITFMAGNFSILFFYYKGFFLLLVISGLIVVLSLLLESFLLNTFLAVSSILNSLLIFLAMSASHSSYLFIFL